MTAAAEIYEEVEKQAGEDNDLVLIRLLELAIEAYDGGCDHCYKKLQYVKTKLQLHHAKKRLNRTERDDFQPAWRVANLEPDSWQSVYMRVCRFRGEADALRAAYRTVKCVCCGDTWKSLARQNGIYNVLSPRKIKEISAEQRERDRVAIEARIKRIQATPEHQRECQHCCFANMAVELRSRADNGLELYRQRMENEAGQYEHLAAQYNCKLTGERTEAYRVGGGRFTNGC